MHPFRRRFIFMRGEIQDRAEVSVMCFCVFLFIGSIRQERRTHALLLLLLLSLLPLMLMLPVAGCVDERVPRTVSLLQLICYPPPYKYTSKYYVCIPNPKYFSIYL